MRCLRLGQKLLVQMLQHWSCAKRTMIHQLPVLLEQTGQRISRIMLECKSNGVLFTPLEKEVQNLLLRGVSFPLGLQPSDDWRNCGRAKSPLMLLETLDHTPCLEDVLELTAGRIEAYTSSLLDSSDGGVKSWLTVLSRRGRGSIFHVRVEMRQRPPRVRPVSKGLESVLEELDCGIFTVGG